MTDQERIEELREQTKLDAPYPRIFPSESARVAAAFLIDQLDKARQGWIPTSERLPTQEDADEPGDWGEIMVLWLNRHGKYNGVKMYWFHVNKKAHTHWARLPDRPEEG